jgi:two-component system, LytTR family, response regulator
MEKVIIIDDEPNSREYLKNLIKEYCPDLKVVGEADGVKSGFSLINKLNPQAIFLDIEMQDGTGFDLLDRFDDYTFQVIFQTSFDEFAIKAFKYNAIDYLLKPVTINDLKIAANKITDDKNHKDANQQLLQLLELTKKKSFDRIVLTSNEGMHFVEISNIIRLQSEVNYTTFYLTSGERMIITKTIKTYEELLPKELFFRTHQSHIVNLKFIKSILREDGGYALMKDGSKIPISRRKKEQLISVLKQNLEK